jgi:hypothetical protein
MTQRPGFRIVRDAWAVVILVLLFLWFVFSQPRPYATYKSLASDDSVGQRACALAQPGMSREEILETVQSTLDPSEVGLGENHYSSPGEIVLVVDMCMISFANGKVSGGVVLPGPGMGDED